jgi:5-methyltetrahydropteroyltriglutamate--homocysteine methyltransferase
MKTSLDRILTTHTGSLPRPASLTDRHDGRAVQDAVRESVTKQLAAGVDVINDGENIPNSWPSASAATPA